MTNFKGLHSVQIKIIKSLAGDAIPTALRALEALIKMVDSGNLSQVKIHNQVSLEILTNEIKEHFGDSVEVREGAQEGCYGATTGETLDGLTVYIDAMELPERWDAIEYEEHAEYFNPLKTMESAGFKRMMIASDEVDAFMETMEDVGCEVKRDNSYNYSGNSETVVPLYDFDFKVIEQDDIFFVAIKFHCGGDIRGNYGSDYLFVCKDNESFYEGLCPSWFGEEGVN